jgi:hypothetical protein
LKNSSKDGMTGSSRRCILRMKPITAQKKLFPQCILPQDLQRKGLGMGIALRDVELVNQPDGKPILKIHNRAEGILREAGIKAIHVSVTHTRKYANAVVILEK